jgi:hypothetical protein
MEVIESQPEVVRKTSERQVHWTDYAMLTVQTLGLIGLVIYAGLTWGIFRENKQAVTEMQRQTRIDERPWVAFSAPESFDLKDGKPIAFVPGQKLQIPIVFTNYGKTAARKNQIAVSAAIVSMGQEPAMPDEAQTLTAPGASGRRISWSRSTNPST